MAVWALEFLDLSLMTFLPGPVSSCNPACPVFTPNLSDYRPETFAEEPSRAGKYYVLCIRKITDVSVDLSRPRRCESLIDKYPVMGEPVVYTSVWLILVVSRSVQYVH